MTIYNDEKITALIDTDGWLRRYVMATTVITPKLTMLLEHIKLKHQDKKIVQCAEENRRRCKTYIHKLINQTAGSTDLSAATLRMTANIYYLYDDITIAAGIREKIVAWKCAYAIADRQYRGLSPFRLTMPEIPKSQLEYYPLTDEQIYLELVDYADEIDAWLEEYFADEYDDYTDDDNFLEILQILTDLKILAQALAPHS